MTKQIVLSAGKWFIHRIALSTFPTTGARLVENNYTSAWKEWYNGCASNRLQCQIEKVWLKFSNFVMSWKNNSTFSLQQFTNIRIFFSPDYFYLPSVNLQEFKYTGIYGDHWHTYWHANTRTQCTVLIIIMIYFLKKNLGHMVIVRKRLHSLLLYSNHMFSSCFSKDWNREYIRSS